MLCVMKEDVRFLDYQRSSQIRLYQCINLPSTILYLRENSENRNLQSKGYTKCKSKSVRSHTGIMPMNRNVKANRVSEDWTVTFLQSVLNAKRPEKRAFNGIWVTKMYIRNKDTFNLLG